ncbi:MAG: hypothetical protein L0H84_24260, partial [Pseudonocardia sp.]|nr:hypothetical protein [Pseudonocardia sp.]
MRAQPVTIKGRAARRRATRRQGRSLRSGLGGALVAGVALLALGVQDATPAPLADLLDTRPTRVLADAHEVGQPDESAVPSTPTPTDAPPTSVTLTAADPEA